MKPFIFNILIFSIFAIFSYGSSLHINPFQPDTIPPPPPGGPALLNGPSTACVGQTSVYTVEVPVGCYCQWSVNTTLQPDTSSTFSFTWSQQGNYIISVAFVCQGGQTSEPQAVVTVVGPPVPVVDLGDDTTLLTGQTLLLDAGNPGSGYLWSTGAISQTILVSQTGSYSVEVYNICGSDTDTIEVTILVGFQVYKPENRPVCIIDGRRIIFREPDINIYKAEIYDLSGRIVFAGEVKGEIHLPSAGIFILKVMTSEMTLIRKIICL